MGSTTTWYGTSFTMIKNRSSLKMLQTHNLRYPSTILPSILRAYKVLFQRQLININRQLLSKKTTSMIFVHPIRCSACILELNNCNNLQKKIPQFFHQKTSHSNQFDTFCIPKPRPRWLDGGITKPTTMHPQGSRLRYTAPHSSYLAWPPARQKQNQKRHKRQIGRRVFEEWIWCFFCQKTKWCVLKKQWSGL